MCLKIGPELGKSTLTANSFRLNQTMKPAAPCLRMIVPLSHFPTRNWWTTGEKPVHQLLAAEYQLHSIFVALKTGTKPMVLTVSDENGALNPAQSHAARKRYYTVQEWKLRFTEIPGIHTLRSSLCGIDNDYSLPGIQGE